METVKTNGSSPLSFCHLPAKSSGQLPATPGWFHPPVLVLPQAKDTPGVALLGLGVPSPVFKESEAFSRIGAHRAVPVACL